MSPRDASRDYGETVRAPEFPENGAWFNTQNPLSIKALAGQFLILYFWTPSDAPSIENWADLKKLKTKHAGRLAVIGIYCSESENDRDPEKVRQVLLENGIEDPVAADFDQILRRKYAIEKLPALYLINPKSKIIATFTGGNPFGPLDQAIEKALEPPQAAVDPAGE